MEENKSGKICYDIYVPCACYLTSPMAIAALMLLQNKKHSSLERIFKISHKPMSDGQKQSDNYRNNT